jgi:hypothetical protein
MCDQYGIQFAEERIKALLKERQKKAMLKKAMAEKVQFNGR